jgi:hypothetical protein
MLFGILLGIDLLAAAVIVGFFTIGLADGTVSSFNIALWLAMLGGTGAILGGGVALDRNGRRTAASGLLAVMAIPAALLGLFFLALIVLQPRWN